MVTLLDIINEIIRIRDVLNEVEVKGRDNQACLVYAYDHCNQLISDLNKTAEEIQNGSRSEEQEAPVIELKEVGEEIGEHDTATAGTD